MNLERVGVGESERPFPVYEDLVDQLLAAHAAGPGERNATAAHLLGILSAYAFADATTVATMMSRLGFGGGACVRLEQTVDAMFVFSTAFLVQSRCGRVMLLGYRGTEPTNLASWLGDADVGPEPMTVGAATLRVHAGFLRNFQATRLSVLAELKRGLASRSLADPELAVDHPLEALYVTGHSLGGAMATLFGLTVAGGAPAADTAHPAHAADAADTGNEAIAARLRAIYTFAQPLMIGEPLPGSTARLAQRIFRHVLVRDPIPTLPAASWGRFVHIGREYGWRDGEWRLSAAPVAQARSVLRFSPSILAFFWSARRRAAARYTLADHAPHHYLAALRPKGRITEVGDPG
jgi:hypothetical protein